MPVIIGLLSRLKMFAILSKFWVFTCGTRRDRVESELFTCEWLGALCRENITLNPGKGAMKSKQPVTISCQSLHGRSSLRWAVISHWFPGNLFACHCKRDHFLEHIVKQNRWYKWTHALQCPMKFPRLAILQWGLGSTTFLLLVKARLVVFQHVSFETSKNTFFFLPHP